LARVFAELLTEIEAIDGSAASLSLFSPALRPELGGIFKRLDSYAIKDHVVTEVQLMHGKVSI
jgi:hypothetical protein